MPRAKGVGGGIGRESVVGDARGCNRNAVDNCCACFTSGCSDCSHAAGKEAGEIRDESKEESRIRKEQGESRKGSTD